MRGTENALYLSHVWLANFALQERKVKVVSITNSRVRRFGSARVLFVHVAKINGFKMLLNAKLQHIPKGKEFIALLLCAKQVFLEATAVHWLHPRDFQWSERLVLHGH